MDYKVWLKNRETHRKIYEISKRWGMEVPEILPYIRQTDLDNWVTEVEIKNL